VSGAEGVIRRDPKRCSRNGATDRRAQLQIAKPTAIKTSSTSAIVIQRLLIAGSGRLTRLSGLVGGVTEPSFRRPRIGLRPQRGFPPGVPAQDQLDHPIDATGDEPAHRDADHQQDRYLHPERLAGQPGFDGVDHRVHTVQGSRLPDDG